MSLFDHDESSNENEETLDQSEEKKPEVKKNFTYFFRHPYSRIATSYLVVFCNFLIFAEDPVSHSYTDCIIDIIGNMYGFVFSRWVTIIFLYTFWESMVKLLISLKGTSVSFIKVSPLSKGYTAHTF